MQEQEFDITSLNNGRFLVSISGIGERIGVGMFLTKKQAKELSDFICVALALRKLIVYTFKYRRNTVRRAKRSPNH